MDEVTFAKDALTRVQAKMGPVADRNAKTMPYTTDEDGHYKDMTPINPYWWTNGFWGGLMWQLYALTGDARYQDVAQNAEAALDGNFMHAGQLDHDNGFKWLPTAVAHYRLDGNAASKNRALLAASLLAGRFNPAGQFLRAWNGDDNAGWAIIDCMMNLPLLYWAAKEEHDPRFAQIAVAHAHTAQRYAVREDGSVRHIITFDPVSGRYRSSLGGQGFGHGSSWTRGQAWGLYGFTLSYRHTNDASFLKTAQAIAEYFIGSIPADGRIPVDFRAPGPFYEDASAAAIAASGLLTLATLVEPVAAKRYRQAAVRLLVVLADTGVDWDPATDALLEHCSAQYHERRHGYPIVYGDYFFVEALAKQTGQVIEVW